MPNRRPPVRRIRKVPRIPKGRRMDVTRAEFDRAIDLMNQRGDILEALRVNQEVQFTRIAQIQAELDAVKREWEQLGARKK